MRGRTPTYQCSGSPAGRSLQGASQLILTMLIMPYSDPLYISNGALLLAFAISSTSLLPWNIVYSVLGSCSMPILHDQSSVRSSWCAVKMNTGKELVKTAKTDSSFYTKFTPSLLVLSVILLLFPNGIMPLTITLKSGVRNFFTDIQTFTTFKPKLIIFLQNSRILSHWMHVNKREPTPARDCKTLLVKGQTFCTAAF